MSISALSSLSYDQFLQSKLLKTVKSGFQYKPSLISSQAFDFQKDIIKWAIAKGKACVFADTGLGKSLMLLNYANQVHQYTNKPVLILAPLAVSSQTVMEGQKFGIAVNKVEQQSECINGINITNYEKLDRFNASYFEGIILDEASIIKNFDGKTRNKIIQLFQQTPYKLACTATPSPNDYMELGNYAEFLGVMSRVEMLSMFFVHDGGDTAKWRLKGHAESEFWKWISTWACFVRHPRDLGYEQQGYDLPKLNIQEIVIDFMPKNSLFPTNKMTLQERREAKKDSLTERVEACAELVNNSDEIWLIWCNLNDEGDLLEKLIKDCVQIAGKHSDEYKEKNLLNFANGKIKCLITKPTIAGFGLNFQVCHNMAFVGLSDSYEQYYQAIRRCWRFGQLHQVNCYVITSSVEGAIVDNIKRKERENKLMGDKIVEYTKEYVKGELSQTTNVKNEYKTNTITKDRYKLMLGDCIERIKEIPDNSIDFSIFSPPFSSLYTYSNSERDMGNCRNNSEFYYHFQFLIKELYRIVKPGRLVAVHCMNMQRLKERDGDMGINDFRGDLIRWFVGDEIAELEQSIFRLKQRLEDTKQNDSNNYNRINMLTNSIKTLEQEIKLTQNNKDFIFHSEVCIWKDPVTAMQRTKSLKLLYKQLKKDSSRSAQGLADYLLVFMKPGENQEPVTKNPSEFPVSKWQNVASPVWMDINPSKTLQKTSAREQKDERHIAPLQLEVIERAIELWTNPNDLVFTPFMGIGSELYQALKMNRQGIGVELKESYFKQAVLNCEEAYRESQTETLFDLWGEYTEENESESENNLTADNTEDNEVYEYEQ